MADIVQKFKTPSGDNIIDKDFADFKGSGGTIGGDLTLRKPVDTDRADLILPRKAVDGKNYKTLLRTGSGGQGVLSVQDESGATLNELILQSDMARFSSDIRPDTSNKYNLGSDLARFKDLFIGTNSANANGYTKLVNGIIMQWGIVNIPQNPIADVFVSYPISFPNVIFSVNANLDNINEAWGGRLFLSDNTFSSNDKERFRAVLMDVPPQGTNLVWTAIGY